MRGEVHILVYSPIDTFQWGSTHSALNHTKFAKICPKIQNAANDLNYLNESGRHELQ